MQHFPKQKPKVVIHRQYKNFRYDYFRIELENALRKYDFNNIDYDNFIWTFLAVLDTHAPIKKKYLKLVSAVFYQILFFTKRWPFKNYEKCFLFHLKSSFRSRDIQFFLFLSSPLFLPVSHYLRSWSKINLKVYDAINCLNKMLITQFVWYLENEKRYDIEPLSIDRVLNKEHFYEKIIQKMCTKS